MESLVKVLKLPTLSIIYEAMDRAKLAIKASIKQWEKYWEVIDRRWEGQLHRHLHAAAFLQPSEIKIGLKEVIKRLEPDLDRQAKAINEVKLFVDDQGEFGSALTKKAINQSLLIEWWNNYGDDGPHLQKIAIKILSQTCSSSEDMRRRGAYFIIDNLDWLDKGLPSNEEGVHVMLHKKEMLILVVKVRLQEQFLQVLVVMMVTKGAPEEMVAGSGYVSQVDLDMSWTQGGENYYATQDTNHGYQPRIWEQRKHLERLTTFPSDDDYFSGHDYHRANYHRIDEHLRIWLVIHMDMINLLVAIALLIKVLDTFNMVLISNNLETIFS
ncbi:hypothetical protein AAG906_024557 [Vitis piasezkii]